MIIRNINLHSCKSNSINYFIDLASIRLLSGASGKFYTEAKLRFTNDCEKTTKKQLSCEIRKRRNMPRISKNSATCRIRICALMQSRDFEFHGLSTQPRKLSNRQILVTNKAATYANKLPMPFSKVAPNTNRLIFQVII